MLVKGSINYSPCGRKRSVKRKKKVQRPPSTLKTNPAMSDRLARIKAEQEKYPSLDSGKHIPAQNTQYKNEVSKRYTVAIAYNKGGYQVISKDNIKDIGK